MATDMVHISKSKSQSQPFFVDCVVTSRKATFRMTGDDCMTGVANPVDVPKFVLFEC